LGAKRILALGSVAALCAGVAAPLFMASAASAAQPPNGTDATFMCLPAGSPPSPVIEAIIDLPHAATLAAAQAFCTGAIDPTSVAVEVTGPAGATGPAGPTGAIGGQGGTGLTGSVGNTGLKGAQGPTGPVGGSGGTGGTGSNGAQGATGPVGGAPTGPTGPGGGTGSQGIIGPQGPSGSQGVTGPTATVIPTFIASAGATALPAGPGELGNTRTVTGNSQILEACPSGTNLVGGGAELLPGNADVRGILESSFPNPASAGNSSNEWVVTAEVTATGTSADSPSTNFLQVVEWVNCQP